MSFLKTLTKWTHKNTLYRIVPYEQGTLRSAYELCEADLWFVAQRRRTGLREILRTFSLWETLFDEKVPDMEYYDHMKNYLQCEAKIAGRCRLELGMPTEMVFAV